MRPVPSTNRSLCICAEINESAFKDAVRQLVNRHDALRAVFIHEGQVQKCAPKLDLNIPTVDLLHLAGRNVTRVGSRSFVMMRTRPSAWSKVRWCGRNWSRWSRNTQRLVFTAHHIVCDGWSTNVLLDELPKIYNAINRGESPASVRLCLHP